MKGTGKRCGFITLLGLPNAGKSTLINQLVGQKVSIVSRKVQTTRSRVLGITINRDTQMVFIDTPGIFEPKKTMERAMVKTAFDALGEADIALHIVDASRKPPRENIIIDRLPRDKPVWLVLNKIDKIKKEELLALSQSLNQQYPYEATFMISALKDDGIERLREELTGRMPESDWLFDEDQVSDMPVRMVAAEITREKLFETLHQEVPYELFVETESWESFDNGSIKISQIIYVQKESQKGIILGKGGRLIKQVGQAARLELEDIMACPVHLKLFVKVKDKWDERQEYLSRIGLQKK